MKNAIFILFIFCASASHAQNIYMYKTDSFLNQILTNKQTNFKSAEFVIKADPSSDLPLTHIDFWLQGRLIGKLSNMKLMKKNGVQLGTTIQNVGDTVVFAIADTVKAGKTDTFSVYADYDVPDSGYNGSFVAFRVTYNDFLYAILQSVFWKQGSKTAGIVDFIASPPVQCVGNDILLYWWTYGAVKDSILKLGSFLNQDNTTYTNGNTLGKQVFTLIVYDAEGDSAMATSTVIVQNCGSGIFPIISPQSLHVFPNPCNDWLTISDLVPGTRISIFDVLGNKISTDISIEPKLVFNTSTWKSGIYFLHADNMVSRFVKD